MSYDFNRTVVNCIWNCGQLIYMMDNILEFFVLFLVLFVFRKAFYNSYITYYICITYIYVCGFIKSDHSFQFHYSQVSSCEQKWYSFFLTTFYLCIWLVVYGALKANIIPLTVWPLPLTNRKLNGPTALDMRSRGNRKSTHKKKKKK